MAGGKLDMTAIIVSAVVGSLGLLSAILGFPAEGMNSNSILCSNQTSAAGLGVSAAIILAIVQVAVMVLAAVAFVLFLAGAIVASNCYLIKGGVFAGAAVLVLLATGLGITSYIMILPQQPQPGGAAAPGVDEPTPIAIAMVPTGSPAASSNPVVPKQSPNYSSAPAQGNAGQAPNQQFPPPAALVPQVVSYGQAPNPHLAAPQSQGGGYGHAPNQQFPPPVALPSGGGRYGQAPNPQFVAPLPAPAPAQVYEPYAPNQQG